MIFLTVGHEMPFDRLVRGVDEWCRLSGCSDVFGQIGDPGPGGYLPQHFEWEYFIEPEEFQQRFETADFIVAHAGMGSIITALTVGKPMVIMPRRGDLMETRNEHQRATADRFISRSGIDVAADESELGAVLDARRATPAGAGQNTASPYAEDGLLEVIRNFIHQPVRP